jgi:hypothetical protein
VEEEDRAKSRIFSGFFRFSVPRPPSHDRSLERFHRSLGIDLDKMTFSRISLLSRFFRGFFHLWLTAASSNRANHRACFHLSFRPWQIRERRTKRTTKNSPSKPEFVLAQVSQLAIHRLGEPRQLQSGSADASAPADARVRTRESGRPREFVGRRPVLR